MLYQVADNTAVSIPYGKGKEVGDYDENMSFSEVSIPYGKGKANPMLKTFEEILYQSPMGKVKLHTKATKRRTASRLVSIPYGKGKE